MWRSKKGLACVTSNTLGYSVKQDEGNKCCIQIVHVGLITGIEVGIPDMVDIVNMTTADM